MISVWQIEGVGAIYHGHVLEVLRDLPEQSAHCCVTSPPYWGLRDYGTPDQVWGGNPDCVHVWGDKLPAAKKSHTNEGFAEYSKKHYRGGGRKATEQAKNRPDNAGQFCQKCGAWIGSLGLEPTPTLFVEHITEIFREVRRVLRDDGTCWVNLGDSYVSGGRKERDPGKSKMHPSYQGESFSDGLRPDTPNRLKPKDIVGIPWRVAFALQADGWYLRQDIIWHKPNPMPESVRDRCTKAHEYIFLFSKKQQYFYDHEAVKEPFQTDPKERYLERARVVGRGKQGAASARGNDRDKSGGFPTKSDGRNKRSVWTVPTKPFAKAHFATFPPALVEPCILAGCPEGGTIIDPFFGSGTTGVVAYAHAREFIGIELSQKYLKDIAIPRIKTETAQMPLFSVVG